MPHEQQLKMIVDGFANTSADFAAWAQFLDLRADAIGGAHFNGKKHIPVPPKNRNPYRTLTDSLQNAAVLLLDIADCQQGMVAHVSQQIGVNLPVDVPDPAETTLGVPLTEPELLQLILAWQQMDLGTFKTFMGLYGLTPSDQPARHGPGATSDQRLGEEIVSWLDVISTDANKFVTNQQFQKAASNPLPAPASVHDALVNFEQQYHRLVNNYLQLLTVLPYHLKRANP